MLLVIDEGPFAQNHRVLKHFWLLLKHVWEATNCEEYEHCNNNNDDDSNNNNNNNSDHRNLPCSNICAANYVHAYFNLILIA